MSEPARIQLPKESEIDIDFIKRTIRDFKKHSGNLVVVDAGLGVLFSPESKKFLERIESKISTVRIVIQTDFLSVKLQANFIKNICLKEMKIRVLDTNSSELKFWLN